MHSLKMLPADKNFKGRPETAEKLEENLFFFFRQSQKDLFFHPRKKNLPVGTLRAHSPVHRNTSTQLFSRR